MGDFEEAELQTVDPPFDPRAQYKTYVDTWGRDNVPDPWQCPPIMSPEMPIVSDIEGTHDWYFPDAELHCVVNRGGAAEQPVAEPEPEPAVAATPLEASMDFDLNGQAGTLEQYGDGGLRFVSESGAVCELEENLLSQAGRVATKTLSGLPFVPDLGSDTGTFNPTDCDAAFGVDGPIELPYLVR